MIGEDTVLSRADVLQLLVQEMLARGPERQLIAIDGVDGSGKSTFAEELAHAIRGRPVVTIHVDDFLNLQDVRHRRGRTSPLGFWLDTYDYDALTTNVLVPLGHGGDGKYRPSAIDLQKDVRIELAARQAPDDALVLVEGMFLHRNELVGWWDYSVFLDVPFAETARRMSVRDGSNPDPEHPSMRRYVGGQRLYFKHALPWSRATRVIDNTFPDQPRLMSQEEAEGRQR